MQSWLVHEVQALTIEAFQVETVHSANCLHVSQVSSLALLLAAYIQGGRN